MRKILISINPEHVDNIINGIKKFEYRRKAAKKDVSSIVIYETKPIKCVVAEAEILEVLEMPLEELWNLTKHASGITKEYYLSYFKGKKMAYAYKLGKVTKYNKPKPLTEFGIKSAPQSFVYIN